VRTLIRWSGDDPDREGLVGTPARIVRAYEKWFAGRFCTLSTAEWIARQITEAFPWAEAPRYLIRDRDRVYGATVTHRLRAMGIRDKPIAPIAMAERLRRKADRIDSSRVR
jgi:hypothetical protein